MAWDEQASSKIGAEYLGYLESIKNLLKNSGNLPEQQVAELNQLYQGAQDLFSQGIGSYQPYVNQGMNTIGAGIGMTGQGADYLTGGAGMAQDVYGQMSQAVPEYLKAASGYGAQGFDLAKQGTAAYDPSSYKAYMDPYQKEVIDQYSKEMQRQLNISQQGRAAQAAEAGAFGGGREGVYQAEGLRGFQDKLGSGIANLLSQGYGQAQQMAQSNFANQMGRLQQAGQTGLGAGQLQLGAAGQQINLGGLGLDAAKQQLMAGQGLGALGGQLGQMGLGQAGIGFDVQKAGLLDVNQMLNFANIQQAQEQAKLDALYNNQMAAYQRPFQELGFYGSAFGYMPSLPFQGQMGGGSVSPLQQIIGYGSLGLGALSGLKGLQGLF